MSDIPSLGSSGTASPDAAPLGRDRLVGAFAVATIVSLVLPRVPYGRNVLYPFALLGTWAHEMGHGLMGELLGSFHRLVLFENLGGYAVVGIEDGLDSVLVSAAGLLGPAIGGGLMIMFAARRRTAQWALAGLAVLILISVVLYVRNGFGVVSMLAIGAILAAIAFLAPPLVRIFVAGFVGIQFCLASWSTRDYMFTKNFERDGEIQNSDTQAIAEQWFLPYWFWGALILATSIIIMAAAFYTAWIKPLRGENNPELPAE